MPRPRKTAAKAPAPDLSPERPGVVGLPGVARATAHRPLSLLEVQDPADLDALLQGRLGTMVLQRLSPTVAVLNPGSDAAALGVLKKAGHTPKVLERL